MQSKLTFKDYKHCSEATQLENEINQLEKINLMKIKYKYNIKTYIKIIKYSKNKEKKQLILKPQQRFRSEKNNEFAEEVNKISLNANND